MKRILCVVEMVLSEEMDIFMPSHPMLERKLIEILRVVEMVLWEEMDVFMRPLDMVKY